MMPRNRQLTKATITVEVDADLAQAFSLASAAERRKLELLLNFRLRELTTRDHRPLQEVMDDIGSRAEAAGLTPAILDSLLEDR
jgi:hypothetical protein